MSHYLLHYDLASDYLERRPQFRDEHLALAWQSVQDGSLILAGAVGEPIVSALFLFRDAESAAAFARSDPYVTDGLVCGWRVTPWHTVVGEDAANPVRPAG